MDQTDSGLSANTPVSRESRRPATRRVAIALATLSFALLIVVSLWPSRIDDAAKIASLLSAWHAEGLPRWIDYSVVERLANLILYVPIGMLLGIVVGSRRWWLALGVAIASSAAVEALQILLVARSSSWVDISMNSLGALTGIAIIMAVRVWPTRADARA